jgi:hypothetical protein
MTPREEKRVSNSGSGRGSVVYYFGQMLFAPFRTLIYGMEILLDAVRGMQRMGERGIHILAGDAPAEPPTPTGQVEDAVLPSAISSEAHAASDGFEFKEAERMDKDLNDDMLKLVRYKILFVKRDYEHAFPEEEELVSDNMDGSAYTAWKVAQFIQSLCKRKTVAPDKWGSYPEDHRDKDVLTGFPEDDKKFLRVFYEVLERYPREKLKYEEDHLKVLRQIRDRMPEKEQADSASGGKGINVS